MSTGYVWKNTSDTLKIYDKKVSSLNTYLGGAYQMATSVISQTNQECYYDGPDPCFAIYGFEYKEGFDDGVSALSKLWSRRMLFGTRLMSGVVHHLDQ